MAYKLLQEEKLYLDLLKETKMLQHTGSGPLDPAPKEKDTKSPVEDGTGQGTKQAATGHPNVIPPLAYLKKELAKEGIFIVGENPADLLAEIEDLSDEQQNFVRMTISEMKKCPECKCEPCECPGEGEEEEEDKKKVSKEAKDFNTELETAIEMCGMPHGNPGKHEKKSKKKVKEQVDAEDAGDKTTDDELEKEPAGEEKEPPGNAMGEQSLKVKNRMAAIAAANRGERVPTRRVAGSPADIAGKRAAFEKRRAMWTKESVENVDETDSNVDEQMAAQVIPQQVQRQRRPVPAAAARPQAVMAIKKPLPPTPTRPVDVSARMRGRERIRRPVPGYGAPRPVRTGRL